MRHSHARTGINFLLLTILAAGSFLIVSGFLSIPHAVATPPETEWRAYPQYEVYPQADPLVVSGYTPTQIHAAYNLPWGGSGTIAIIDAYDAPTVQSDLNYFSNYFGLSAPSYEEHQMYTPLEFNSGWALETVLDVEWAHAIAPSANILLVQAKSNMLSDLLEAVDYARTRPDVVAISMSWGGDEFPNEANYDYHFTNAYGAVCFASSGDDGAGVIWPSSSAAVIGVGGTTLNLDASGNVLSETAWSGSGGGSSAYLDMPSYQSAFGISGTKRAIPDVSYDANPSTGFPVYISGSWIKVGGTSAGTPQWAAIQALGHTSSNTNFYADAATAYGFYFRDIVSGSNGGFTAGVGYDRVTGLGSPITVNFNPSLETTTTLTLHAAGGSTPLSGSNRFTVTYTNNSLLQTAYAQEGTLALTADPNTNVTIAGISSSSTATEKWLLNSNGDSFNITSGATTTLYYYDLLTQTTSYTIAGTGNPSDPTLSYLTAPAVASGSPSPTSATIQLSQSSPAAVWAIKGSSASATNPLIGGSSEHWQAQTSIWTIIGANSLPSAVIYYHQYLATFNYQIIGGGIPTPPALTSTAFGATSTATMPSTAFSTWLDANSQYSFSNLLSSSTGIERWSTTTLTSGSVNGPMTASAAFYHQYLISPMYTLIGGGTPQTPVFAYSNYGNSSSINLSTNPQTAWADSNTGYTVPSPLGGSSASERWFTTSSSGTVQSSTALTFTYYHQFNVSAVYSLVGGGTPTAPTMSSINLGTPVQSQLTNSSQWFWIDSNTQCTIQTLLIGSTATERWSSSANSITVQGAVVLNFSYNHQFLLNVTGAQPSTQWYNNGEMAQVSVPSIFGRASGTGQRVTSYQVDSGNPVVVQLGTGTVDISVFVNSTHQLQINSVNQYQVTLDASAAKQLAFITPPTISGDNYWYDEGTPLRIMLNGLGVRTAGHGERLSSYTVNGVPTVVATISPVEALNISSILSPRTITATIMTQYQLSTLSGSVASITAPSILGDAGWYDTATPITITYDYSWNIVPNQSRTNALNYKIGQSATVPLARSAIGTFPVQLTMTEPQSITVSSITQYNFNVVGGLNVFLSQSSPTGDSYYDAGTSLTATSDYAWSLINGTSRIGLVSYTLDGATTNIAPSDAINFTAPVITFNSAHQLTFNSAVQYLVLFQFKDNSENETITPSSFQITITNLGIIDAPQFTVWLENGTQFQIQSVIWQNADVKPTDQASYLVISPLNLTILCRIFNAQLVLHDSIGNPLAGAQVAVTLANQTIINMVTGDIGTVNLPMIPQGTFTASITYLGSTTTVTGDASSQAVTTQVISQSPSPSPSSTPAPPSSSSPTPTASSHATPTASPNPVIPEIASPTAIAVLMIITCILAVVLRKKIFAR